jgi:hypothetical protein
LRQKSVGDAEIALIAATLSDRAAELAKAMIASIRSEADFYRDTDVISDDTLQATAMANFAFIFSGLSGRRSFDTSPATFTGEQRAQAGVPLPAVMAGFRVGWRSLWQALLGIADSTGVRSYGPPLNTHCHALDGLATGAYLQHGLDPQGWPENCVSSSRFEWDLDGK